MEKSFYMVWASKSVKKIPVLYAMADTKKEAKKLKSIAEKSGFSVVTIEFVPLGEDLLKMAKNRA